MTKQQSVQRAYQWATAVSNNPKSPCLTALSARQVTRIVEANDDYGAAYDALIELVAEWRKRSSQEKVAEIVAPMLVLERSFSPG